jgi:hypothetical protein
VFWQLVSEKKMTFIEGPLLRSARDAGEAVGAAPADEASAARNIRVVGLNILIEKILGCWYMELFYGCLVKEMRMWKLGFVMMGLIESELTTFLR